MGYTKVQNAQKSEAMNIRLRTSSLLIESSIDSFECQPNQSRVSIWTVNIEIKLKMKFNVKKLCENRLREIS